MAHQNHHEMTSLAFENVDWVGFGGHTAADGQTIF